MDIRTMISVITVALCIPSNAVDTQYVAMRRQGIQPPACDPDHKLATLYPEAQRQSFQSIVISDGNLATCFQIKGRPQHKARIGNQISFGSIRIKFVTPVPLDVWFKSKDGNATLPDKVNKFEGGIVAFWTGLPVGMTGKMGQLYVLGTASDEQPAGSELGIDIYTNLPGPRCSFGPAKRDMKLDIKARTAACFHIHVHADAPFMDGANETSVGIIRTKTKESKSQVFVLGRRVLQKNVEPWRVLDTQETSVTNTSVSKFWGHDVVVGEDTIIEFVVISQRLTQIAFHVRGLLECPPGELGSIVDFQSTMARGLEHYPTACFRVPIPNEHAPGNYIEAALSTARDLHNEFRLFAHYEAELPWNEIGLSPGSTVLKGDLTFSSFKIPVPKIVVGRAGMQALVMVAAKKQMAFEVVFREPTLNCKFPYSPAVPGYLPGCPTSGCMEFKTLAAAKTECDKTASSGCHGITRKGLKQPFTFETRTGRWPATTTSGEVSYQRHRNATLGQIHQSHAISVEHPLCLLTKIQMPVANKQHQLTVTLQAPEQMVLRYYRVYMQVNDNWRLMDERNDGVPTELTFTGPMPIGAQVKKGKDKNLLNRFPIAVIGPTIEDSLVTVSVDSEAAGGADLTATEITACSKVQAVVVFGTNHTTNLKLKHDKSSCVEVVLPEYKGLYSALRLVVSSDHLMPPLAISSEESPEVVASDDETSEEQDGIAGHMNGFLKILQLIRNRLSRDVIPGATEPLAPNRIFWSPVASTGTLPQQQAYSYNLVEGKDRLKFQISQQFLFSTDPQVVAAASKQSDYKVSFELMSPVCTFEERLPLGQRVMGKVVTEPGTKEVTACYLVAISEQDLQHSDKIEIKLASGSAAKALDVFVQKGQALGEKLGTPTFANDVATYSYCASRADNGAVSDSCKREIKTAGTTVLRVALVAHPGEDLTFSIQFHNFGPSCKFPVPAQLTGDVEYPMLMGSDNHVCYQIDPPAAHPAANAALATLSALDHLAAPKLGGTFSVVIEAETPEAQQAFALLRVYGMKAGSSEWSELPARDALGLDGAKAFTFSYGLTPDDRQAYTNALSMLNSSQVPTFVQSFTKEMNKPSFLSVTVDSPTVMGYKIWFREQLTEAKEENGNQSPKSNFIFWAIVGIVSALGILILVIVVSTSGNDTSNYQTIDQKTVQMQTFNTLQEDDEDIIASQGDCDDLEDLEDAIATTTTSVEKEVSLEDEAHVEVMSK